MLYKFDLKCLRMSNVSLPDFYNQIFLSDYILGRMPELGNVSAETDQNEIIRET